MSGPLRKRTSHGAGAKNGSSVTYESVGTDEMRTPPPGSADPIERRTDGTFTSAGAAAAARMRQDAARVPDFAAKELDFVVAEDFAPFDTGRRELTERRRRETHEKTGGVSSAVGATLRGEAWLTAFAEYWAQKAAETGDPEAAERSMRFFKAASGERVRAWDYAATEAGVRGPQVSPRDRLNARILAAKGESSD